MDPFSLLALVAAAGFIFKSFKDTETDGDKRRSRHTPKKVRELTYSKDVVARPKILRPVSADVDLKDIEVLPEYELVRSLVRQKFPIVFVTGGAGTGKSTFIRWLLNEFDGSVLLGAPTAMAAVNIDGKTLHSLCQLPPAWIVRKDIKSLPRRREIREAQLLIIDEISMVTANLLDGVSAFFRLNKGIDKPFGGMPVILVGDMFQLPPVVTGSTRELFERVYGSAKFYNAKCLGATTYYAVELNRTFRQVDQDFVDVLTKIREGVDLQASLAVLNSKCGITDSPPAGAVWLSPRNAEVDQKNQVELRKIDSEPKVYRGQVVGSFKTDRLPSPMELVVKVGAQVMFTKNDFQKRWINGSVGVVKRIGDDSLTVELSVTGTSVEVGSAQWSDYQYTWNAATSDIDRDETGSFTQFPLVLAWAITIHKSQGKTIEKVHLDLGAGAFETGQSYVALSRCRSMEGLTLTRRLTTSDILVDHESKDFYDHLRTIIKKLPPDELMKTLVSGAVGTASQAHNLQESDIPF